MLEYRYTTPGEREATIPTESVFFIDVEGHPTGGFSDGGGFHIDWQNGALEANGALMEDVIEAVLQRLRWYQTTSFSCRENALAITDFESGVNWLRRRTLNRRRRGVQGKYEV